MVRDGWTWVGAKFESPKTGYLKGKQYLSRLTLDNRLGAARAGTVQTMTSDRPVHDDAEQGPWRRWQGSRPTVSYMNPSFVSSQHQPVRVTSSMCRVSSAELVLHRSEITSDLTGEDSYTPLVM